MALKDIFSTRHDNSDLHAKDDLEVKEDKIASSIIYKDQDKGADEETDDDPYYGILVIYTQGSRDVLFLEHLSYEIYDSGVLDIELPEIEGDDEPHFVINGNYAFEQVSKKEFERLKKKGINLNEPSIR